jgi:hypothetical protein
MIDENHDKNSYFEGTKLSHLAETVSRTYKVME